MNIHTLLTLYLAIGMMMGITGLFIDENIARINTLASQSTLCNKFNMNYKFIRFSVMIMMVISISILWYILIIIIMIQKNNK